MDTQNEHIAFHALTSTERMRAWRKANPERSKAIARAHAAKVRLDADKLEKRRETYRTYYHSNKETCHNAHKTWRDLNLWASISDRCRSLIRTTLNGFQSGGPKFQSLVGCTGVQLRNHIQSKWLPGMDWTNFGRGGWTVGHIKACASFKDVLTTPEGQQACFHFSNLQPEWERSNLAKFTSDYLSPAQLVLLKRNRKNRLS